MAPYLSLIDQKRLRICVPPIEVQRAIASVLGALDDKIELNRRMNETLEAMARALFKSWFIDFDPVRAKAEGRDPGLPASIADRFPVRFVDTEIGEVPEGWASRSVYAAAEVIYGAPFSSTQFNVNGIGLPAAYPRPIPRKPERLDGGDTPEGLPGACRRHRGRNGRGVSSLSLGRPRGLAQPEAMRLRAKKRLLSRLCTEQHHQSSCPRRSYRDRHYRNSSR
jgi:hypothetical protein